MNFKITLVNTKTNETKTDSFIGRDKYDAVQLSFWALCEIEDQYAQQLWKVLAAKEL